MAFFCKAHAFPIPAVNSLVIIDTNAIFILLLLYCYPSHFFEAHGEGYMLSALPFKRGIKHAEAECYVATLRNWIDESDSSPKDPLPKCIQDVLDAGYIQPSLPMVLQSSSKRRRMVHCGCALTIKRALNKITIKNKYPIPLIADLFDQLGWVRRGTFPSRICVQVLVRIAAGDEPKTTCVTRYGAFEFLAIWFDKRTSNLQH